MRSLFGSARTARVLAAVALGALLTASCDNDDVTGVGSLASLVVSPNSQSLAINATQQFTAVGKDGAGNTIGITPTWSVVSGGGTISPTGMFTAGTTIGTFTATVKATSGSLSSTATVLVTVGPLASIAVTMTPSSLAIGTGQQFTAVGKDAGGNVIPITVVWAVINGGGTVNATGMFTAGMVSGTFTNTVRASSGGVSGTASVTVTAGPLTTLTVAPNSVTLSGGATQQYTATGADASGNAVLVTPTWSVVNGGGAIAATSGLFTAGSASGTFANTVTATSGSISGTATVTISSGPLATISVAPNPATLIVGGAQQFVANGADANGNPVPVTASWSVVNGGGTINASTGMFTAGSAGSYANTVKATSGTLSGTATVNVSAATLRTITVSPNPTTVTANGTRQFTAMGTDATGNPIAITPVWSVVNTGGSINSSTGLFTAGAGSGTFTNTVRASFNGVSGFATVTVTPINGLATITVSPNPATVNPNATQQFTAVGRDGNGVVVAITPVWSALSSGAIDPATGLFTAGATTGTYSNDVTATSGVVSGSATVVVSNTIPPSPTISLGSAAPNGIMAGTAVTCINLGTISADVSISPGNTLTGFGPCVITGVRHLNDAVAAQGQIDLTNTYNALAGRPCGTNIVANLGGTTLNAGTYCSASSIGVTGTLTLDGQGNPNATFVFQAGSGLTTAGNVVLINGALARNVWWQVGSSATIGTASQWQGNIVTLTSITLVDNANLNGRALARNGAVSLGTNNTITLP